MKVEKRTLLLFELALHLEQFAVANPGFRLEVEVEVRLGGSHRTGETRGVRVRINFGGGHGGLGGRRHKRLQILLIHSTKKRES